jgi:hypothetical protein
MNVPQVSLTQACSVNEPAGRFTQLKITDFGECQ